MNKQLITWLIVLVAVSVLIGVYSQHKRHVNSPGALVRSTTHSGYYWKNPHIVVRTPAFTDFSLALGANEKLAMCYSRNYKLYFGEYTGSNKTHWSDELVDGGEKVGTSISLAAGPNDTYYVAYGSLFGDKLRFATKQAGAWKLEVVPTPEPVSILSDIECQVDEKGIVYVCYTEAHEDSTISIRVAMNSSDNWSFEEVSTGGLIENQVSMCIDDNGNRVVAFATAQSGSNKGGVFVATSGSSGWTIERIADTEHVTGWPHIAKGKDGRIGIVYNPGETIGTLTYALRGGTAWSSSLVTTGTEKCSIATSLCFDANDNPVICYGVNPSEDEYGIYLARLNGATWEQQNLYKGSRKLWLGNPSVISDMKGPIYVAYGTVTPGGNLLNEPSNEIRFLRIDDK